MSDNIKVVLKVRPLIYRELADKLQQRWRLLENTLHGETGQAFTFDKVYNEDTRTEKLYCDVVDQIVRSAINGINGTIFAYGQTSSGKTYTMTGTEDSPGIIPLSVINVFQMIKNIPDRDFLIRVSYIEIYNDTVKDLLDIKKLDIKIHEYNGCIKVDATEKVTSSPEEVLEAMRKGEANRKKGKTNMNETSSRSHSIFQITIESREHTEGTEATGCVNVSQLNLVDLAGSERARPTGATGIRFKESTHINKSLSALALVIKQLSEDPYKYANYRDSKLTRILQNSLGGNAKTLIICTITPVALEETISTLRFATRAKTIKNKPEVNAVATDATMIQSLTKQLAQLQSQLESKKNLEVILENKNNVEQDLHKKIAALQKVILNGFGQRSSIEQIGGARSKQPSRRATLPTLHSIDEDYVSAAVLAMKTPLLKDNLMLIPSKFAPIQNASKMWTLPEEPARVITPPPDGKRNNLSGDVIEIGKLPPKPAEKDLSNFMDMSQDISLVNSDNESSVIASNEDESDLMKAKCQTIVQHSEQSTHDLERLINSVIENNVLLENENKLYKSNIDALNDTIKSQKEKINIAQKEISMYTRTIQDLQVQLKNNDDLLNMRLSDTSNVVKEMGSTSNNIQELEEKLAAKESKYDFEISSAVTLDDVKKEQEIHKSLIEGCQKLLEHKIITSDLALSGSLIDNISIFIDHIINQSQSKSVKFQQLQTENEMLSLEINISKNILDSKKKELNELKIQNQSLRDIHSNVTLDLSNKEENILTLKTAHDDLSNAYNFNIQANINKLNEINKLTEELSNLRERINKQERLIPSLAEIDTKITDLLRTIEKIQQNNEKLNEDICIQKETINKTDWLISSITKKDTKITELLQSIDVLQQDEEKLSEEICSLKYTIGKKESLISSLTESLSENNAKTIELLQTIKELQQDNDRLTSINQTISKESESYSTDLKMSRETIKQNNAEIDRMTSAISILRESVKDTNSIIESLKQDVQKLTAVNSELNLSLEEKIRECVILEKNIKIHDKTAELQSKIIIRLKKQKEEDDRVINEKQTKINEVNEKYNTLQYEWQKLRNAKESLEARVSPAPSRSSLRRRQSLLAGKWVLEHLGEHRDMENWFASRQKPYDLFAEHGSCGRSTLSGLGRGEANSVQAQLDACRLELAELRDRYREVDDECETCAEYLHERDQQCARMKKEKVALQKQILELKSQNTISSQKPSVAHVAANTDEDWAMLHSEVVDRMSYDAEVEKNKTLTNTMAKMQKDFEKQLSSKDNKELDSTRKELEAVKEELEQLKVKYKELDEECETCAEYLKEREEKCRELKAVKLSLENQQITDVMKENHRLKKINAKLVNLCKKRGKSDVNKENEDPCDQE